jgi:YVTN family beta-propeller protein
MKPKFIILLSTIALFCVWAFAPKLNCFSNASPTLKKVGSIDLPGKTGKRFDYLTIDYKHNYLFSAHLGADVLYVIDLKTDKLVKMITNTPGAEGVEYVEELNKVYTSNWGDHTVGVIDMNKMEVIKKIPVISKPDGNVYASHFKKLYVSDERGKTLFVIDVNKDEVIKKIAFDSETGMPQYDSISKKIYLNLQDKNVFVVINPKNDSIIGKYPVGDCKGNHGMALDVPNRLAFLACEENDVLTVLNLETFKPVAYIKIPSGCDVVKYDPGLKRIYVACYEGTISVIQENDATHFTKLEDFPVQKKVHSLAVDIKTHKVYAPEQEEDGKGVSRMIIYEVVK